MEVFFTNYVFWNLKERLIFMEEYFYLDNKMKKRIAECRKFLK
jgi:hypothetical protein